MRECPNCKTILEDDELFCHECGTKQEIEESVASNEEAAPLEKKCIHCGETIEEDSAFCPYCGKSQVVGEVKDTDPEVEKDSVSEEKAETKKEDNPAPEEKEKPKEAPVQETTEERSHYDWEDEPKSKKWIWILLAVLLAGAGAWYFFSQNNYPSESEQTMAEAVDTDSIEEPDEIDEYDDVPASPLAFLEQFYKGDYEKEDYIKQHVTANVINKLKRDYEYECPSGDCLATWVFTAYPPGSDLYLEEGPIITESKEEGKYSVYYSYYSQGQSGRIYKPRGLLVSVTQIDGKYLISDYELVMPDIVENQDGLANNKDGQYYMRDGRLFLHLIKKGAEIEGDFNFRDGTYVSASYEFSCLIDDENKFCTDVYRINGKKSGKIEGVFENGVMKVEVGVDNQYSGTYELKVDEQNGNND